MRFPNSMAGCNDKGGVSRCWEQVGQSGQPSPESLRRTAAPVTMLSTTITTVTWVMRRKARGVTPAICTGGPSYRGADTPSGAQRARRSSGTEPVRTRRRPERSPPSQIRAQPRRAALSGHVRPP